MSEATPSLVDVTAVVRRVVAARVRDRHLIEDLTQETLTRVAAVTDRLDPDATRASPHPRTPPAMPTDVSRWIDRHLLDRTGLLVGVVVDVYNDPTTGRAAWLAVATGFFGTRIGIVPIASASLVGDTYVTIPYDRSIIEAAPPVTISVAVTATDHQQLTSHYHPPNRQSRS